MSTRSRTVRPQAVRLRSAGAAVATLAALGLLAGCGDDTGGSAGSAGSADSADSAPGGTASSGGTVTPDTEMTCPAQLAGGVGDPLDPAASAPEIEEPAVAWICRYELEGGWQLAGDPVQVPEGDLAALGDDLAALAPADPGLFCTEEIGPRWLLTTVSADSDETGVVVDDFGCRGVRLTDDPGSTAPGEARGSGLVPGALQSPDDLARTLSSIHGG